MTEVFKKQKACPPKQLRRRGFTVLEILTVCAVIGLLVLIVLPGFSTLRQNQVVKGAASDTLSAISTARSRTLGSLNSLQYGVHFQSDKVVIFKGTTYVSSASDNESISIVSPASISNVTLGGISGTSGDVYFSRLSGAPSATGTVTISASSVTKIITISATGPANMN